MEMRLILIVLAIFPVYTILKILYRLFLHPLARFPGPILAAISHKYEFYFDGIQPGQYNKEIARLHKIYGPIIRVNPDELHCSDPEFVDEIFAGSKRRRNKSDIYCKSFGPAALLAGFGTADHDWHRSRRAPLNKFFSKASISKLESQVQAFAQQLCDVILSRSGTGQPFDITSAYSCFTTDVISEYCFGQKAGLLDGNNFDLCFRKAIHGNLYALPVMRQWPIIAWSLQQLPYSAVKTIDPELGKYITHIQMLESHVADIKKAYDSKGEQDAELPNSIFIDILDSNMPPEEKTVARLGVEAGGIINAGTETTAWTLTALTYYVLSQPAVYQKLTTELKAAIRDPTQLPKWSVLEKLPYLTATITEAIRLSYGVVTRLARIPVDEDLIYDNEYKIEGKKQPQRFQYTIPKGQPIGMSATIVHLNEDLFPDAESFIPERWLKADGTRRTELERYLLSFSKGSRQCLGMNLAYCELYFAVAALTLRVFPKLSFYETDEKDVKYFRDCFVPMPVPETQGVRVTVK